MTINWYFHSKINKILVWFWEEQTWVNYFPLLPLGFQLTHLSWIPFSLTPWFSNIRLFPDSSCQRQHNWWLRLILELARCHWMTRFPTYLAFYTCKGISNAISSICPQLLNCQLWSCQVYKAVKFTKLHVILSPRVRLLIVMYTLNVPVRCHNGDTNLISFSIFR